jgi:hypothetical protein
MHLIEYFPVATIELSSEKVAVVPGTNLSLPQLLAVCSVQAPYLPGFWLTPK